MRDYSCHTVSSIINAFEKNSLKDPCYTTGVLGVGNIAGYYVYILKGYIYDYHTRCDQKVLPLR